MVLHVQVSAEVRGPHEKVTVFMMAPDMFKLFDNVPRETRILDMKELLHKCGTVCSDEQRISFDGQEESVNDDCALQDVAGDRREI